MLKNRHTISSIKVTKRPIRPTSSNTYQTKPSRYSLQINTIISSLQRNVKDLKTFYHPKQQIRPPSASQTKSKNNIRYKKILKRNGSQTNLRPRSSQNSQQAESHDKAYADIFQVKNHFLRVNGRQTNNIVQLYEFYKKNVEKKQKSTRILASIDLSNPTMGLSLDVGKQSIIRPQIMREPKQKIREEAQSQKLVTEERYECSSKWQNSSNINKTKTVEKPSNLAADLLSKGLYNIANVANLMINKKYKLTKQKQQSFQIAKQRKQKLKVIKPQTTNQNNLNFINSAHIKQIKQSPKKQVKCRTLTSNQKKIKSNSKSKEVKRNQLDQNYSFQQQKGISSQSSHKKAKQQQSISQINPFDASSIKKVSQSPKINQISDLQQSPIAHNKGKDFIKSKYYVQPIPAPNKRNNEQKSISLKSNSKIIDMDMLPFDI